MRKIWIVGSSHGVYLGSELEKIARESSDPTFVVRNFSHRGAKYEQLIWPKVSEVKETDVIIVIPFGNDLLRGYSVKRRGFWHLEKFFPQTNRKFVELYLYLYHDCSKYSCKILVLSNFYRMFCCELHKHHGWLKYQYIRNRELQQELADLEPRVRVLDHRALVDDRAGKKRAKQNIHYYTSLQRDNVHFRRYDIIAKNVYAAAL